MGPERFGFYSESVILIGYLMILDFALIFPIMKNVGSLFHKGDIKILGVQLRNSLGIYLLIGILGMGLLFSAAEILSGRIFDVSPEFTSDVTLIFQITGLNFLGQIMINWGKNVLNGLGQVKISNLFFISYPLIWTIGGLFVLVLGKDWIWIFWIKAVSSVFVGLLQILWVTKSINHSLFPSFSFKNAGLKRTDLKRGLSIRLTDQVFIRYDQFLIGAVIGAESLGIYSVAFMIPNAVLMVMNKMNEFVVHTVTRFIHEEDEKGKRRFYEIGASIFSFLAIFSTSCLIILGNGFLGLWVGQEIGIKAYPILIVLSAGLGLTCLFAPFGIPFLLGIDRYDLVSKYKWIKSVSILILVSLGLYFYGTLGAAYGVLASGISDLVFIFISQNSIGYKNVASFIQKLALGLIFGGISFGLISIFRGLQPFDSQVVGFSFELLILLLFWFVAFIMGPWIPGEIKKKLIRRIG